MHGKDRHTFLLFCDSYRRSN